MQLLHLLRESPFKDKSHFGIEETFNLDIYNGYKIYMSLSSKKTYFLQDPSPDFIS